MSIVGLYLYYVTFALIVIAIMPLRVAQNVEGGGDDE